jgi:uncharacterized protein with ParB-like and HNH nuclease domain
MLENEINLKTITELLGLNFYIPEYQRGYRWSKDNVTQLLDDIWEYRNKGTAYSFYCLQPVVVKLSVWKDGAGNDVNGYELIDGQQRLTTLHRIITFLQLEHLNGGLKAEGYENELYDIYYKTRLESKDFLNTSNNDASMPDLYYMSEAYKTIKSWFEDGKKGIARQVKDKMLSILIPGIVLNEEGKKVLPEWSVQVIWYEIKEDKDNSHQKSEDLFKRLNRGKIPLTSAELIKAKFVNKESLQGLPNDEQIKKKTELIQIWDEIEVQLNDPKFWAFITNKSAATYSSKIELLFDTITGKMDKELDPLYSFIHFFDIEETSESLWKKWIEVEEIYRALIYWFKDNNYYHKIGYLIETGSSIKSMVDLKKANLKSNFDKAIDKLIAAELPIDWEDLRFDNAAHKEKIAHVLLLHNLEKIRKNKHNHEYFPFQIYKSITKSLEHIHAQNIEDMNPNDSELWKAWLKEHLIILEDNVIEKGKVEALNSEIEQALPTLTFSHFNVLGNKIINLLPKDEEEDSNSYLHKIENIALLGLSENIILGNSVFEAKRRKIVDMDKEGAFLPVATKRIFLKYYAKGDTNKYSIWTKKERENYREDIRETLKPYFSIAN